MSTNLKRKNPSIENLVSGTVHYNENGAPVSMFIYTTQGRIYVSGFTTFDVLDTKTSIEVNFRIDNKYEHPLIIEATREAHAEIAGRVIYMAEKSETDTDIDPAAA